MRRFRRSPSPSSLYDTGADGHLLHHVVRDLAPPSARVGFTGKLLVPIIGVVSTASSWESRSACERSRQWSDARRRDACPAEILRTRFDATDCPARQTTDVSRALRRAKPMAG